MGGRYGFTLMEVLVAVAICGISLGVALSGLSQGHRAVERAMLMKKAGLATRLAIMEISSRENATRLKEGEEIEGEIRGLNGWHYMVEVQELRVRVVEDGNSTAYPEDISIKAPGPEQEETVEVNGLKEVKLKITGPGGSSFTVVSWR